MIVDFDEFNKELPPSPSDKAKIWAWTKSILLMEQFFRDDVLSNPDIEKLRFRLEDALTRTAVSIMSGAEESSAKKSLTERFQALYEFMQSRPETSRLEHLESMNPKDEAGDQCDLIIGQAERIYKRGGRRREC